MVKTWHGSRGMKRKGEEGTGPVRQGSLGVESRDTSWMAQAGMGTAAVVRNVEDRTDWARHGSHGKERKG